MSKHCDLTLQSEIGRTSSWVNIEESKHVLLMKRMGGQRDGDTLNIFIVKTLSSGMRQILSVPEEQLLSPLVRHKTRR